MNQSSISSFFVEICHNECGCCCYNGATPIECYDLVHETVLHRNPQCITEPWDFECLEHLKYVQPPHPLISDRCRLTLQSNSSTGEYDGKVLARAEILHQTINRYASANNAPGYLSAARSITALSISAYMYAKKEQD